MPDGPMDELGAAAGSWATPYNFVRDADDNACILVTMRNANACALITMRACATKSKHRIIG